MSGNTNIIKTLEFLDFMKFKSMFIVRCNMIDLYIKRYNSINDEDDKSNIQKIYKNILEDIKKIDNPKIQNDINARIQNSWDQDNIEELKTILNTINDKLEEYKTDHLHVSANQLSIIRDLNEFENDNSNSLDKVDIQEISKYLMKEYYSEGITPNTEDDYDNREKINIINVYSRESNSNELLYTGNLLEYHCYNMIYLDNPLLSEQLNTLYDVDFTIVPFYKPYEDIDQLKLKNITLKLEKKDDQTNNDYVIVRGLGNTLEDYSVKIGKYGISRSLGFAFYDFWLEYKDNKEVISKYIQIVTAAINILEYTGDKDRLIEDHLINVLGKYNANYLNSFASSADSNILNDPVLETPLFYTILHTFDYKESHYILNLINKLNNINEILKML